MKKLLIVVLVLLLFFLVIAYAEGLPEQTLTAQSNDTSISISIWTVCDKFIIPFIIQAAGVFLGVVLSLKAAHRDERARRDALDKALLEAA